MLAIVIVANLMPEQVGASGTYTYDQLGRLTTSLYVNGTCVSYAYDAHGRALVDQAVGELAHLYASFGRVDQLRALFDEIGDRPITGSVLDALGQTKQYAYAEDNRLPGITHLNAVDPTPDVTFSYDPYSRVSCG